MYNYEDIRSVHLEVTSKCQAACPMCARNVQGLINNPFLKLNEVTLKLFKKWFPVEFISQLERIYMCGNFGDPIIAKDTLEIFEYARSINPGMHLSMNTNGSARPSFWWRQLARQNVTVRFGIDGLEDTHSLYRINTDWNKIIENARAFIDSGGYAIWDMLVFKHNVHQIDRCRNMAGDIGFKEFHSKNTSRFRNDILEVLDKSGKTMYTLEPTERSVEQKEKIKEVKNSEDTVTISCKVQKEKSIYVAANGNILPCCWLDHEYIVPSSTSRIDFLNHFGSYPNLHGFSIQTIFDSGFFKDIENTWKDQPLKECRKQCGTYDRFQEQFK